MQAGSLSAEKRKKRKAKSKKVNQLKANGEK